MSGLSRARRHFEGGLPGRAERLRRAVSDMVDSATTHGAEALVREVYAIRTSARVFKMASLERDAQLVAEQLEVEVENGGGVSKVSREAMLEFLSRLARYGDGNAERGSSPRLSTAPAVRDSLSEVRYRTEPDSSVRNYLSVLVVGQTELPSLVRRALPRQRFEVITCSDWQTAVRIAENQRPDVIIAERALGAENTTAMWGRLSRLGLPWVEVVPELRAGVERRRWPQIAPPFGTEDLLGAIEKATGLLAQGDGQIGNLGNLTLEGVTARLVREIERGLLEATDAGHDVQVPLEGGTEVLAAAWSAVAQVRALISQRSGGRVQFRDPPGLGGTSFLAMGSGTKDQSGSDRVDLVGRRIVVADDDRAVRWFFTRLLQGAGAQVVPAANGKEALAVSRALRPDLIISDILMPELDGLGLCQLVRRDPTLWDIPIILLSWKDDFIQQMRHLEAGAQDYLRKEEEEGQLLRRISATLEPRREIERRLRETGDVRGRLEPLGVGVLLRTVGAERQDADVEVRSYEHCLQVRVRGGVIAEVVVEMRDGMRVAGTPALRALAGVRGGRFCVTAVDPSVGVTKGATGGLPLSEVHGELFGMLEACQGERLASIQDVSLEPVFLGLGGEACSRLEVRLMEGGTPLAAVADGSLTADEVSALLRDLVLRGACARLRGSDGADLGAHYLAARTGNEVARHQEGPTVREVRPRPATLLQWGKDGSEARTFAEFELAESRVRKALMAQEESATDSVRGNISEDLTDWVKEDSEGGADEPLAVTAGDEVVPPPTVPPEDVADDEFVEASVELQVPPTSRFSSSGWLLIAILLCGLGFLGHQLWTMDRVGPVPSHIDDTTAQVSVGEIESVSVVETTDASDAQPDEADSSTLPAVEQRVVPESEGSFGQLLEPVVTELELAADEGVLRVEVEPTADAEMTVLLGSRDLGAPPVEAAVRDGIHALWLRRSVEGQSRVAVRWIRVVRQQTRVVQIEDFDAP